MRVVFFGSSSFAEPSLRLLKTAHEVLAVVTQPDRPVGRGGKPAPTPVKNVAEELGLPLVQPVRASSVAFLSGLRELRPEAVVVVAYGQLLTKPALELAPFGCVNLHPSLLPKYRGAAPIQRAIWNGETETGVSVMRLDEGEDTGPIYAQRRFGIGPDETALELSVRLAEGGAELLSDALATLPERTAVAQDEALASRAPRLERSSGQLNWSLNARTLYDQFRACVPWPGSFTYLPDGSRLRVLDCRPSSDSLSSSSGAVSFRDGVLAVRAGTGALTLRRVQPENRVAMSPSEFVNGLRGRMPERFHWRDEDTEGGTAKRCDG